MVMKVEEARERERNGGSSERGERCDREREETSKGEERREEPIMFLYRHVLIYKTIILYIHVKLYEIFHFANICSLSLWYCNPKMVPSWASSHS